jgi:hypothetical protein
MGTTGASCYPISEAQVNGKMRTLRPGFAAGLPRQTSSPIAEKCLGEAKGLADAPPYRALLMAARKS